MQTAPPVRAVRGRSVRAGQNLRPFLSRPSSIARSSATRSELSQGGPRRGLGRATNGTTLDALLPFRVLSFMGARLGQGMGSITGGVSGRGRPAVQRDDVRHRSGPPHREEVVGDFPSPVRRDAVFGDEITVRMRRLGDQDAGLRL